MCLLQWMVCDKNSSWRVISMAYCYVSFRYCNCISNFVFLSGWTLYGTRLILRVYKVDSKKQNYIKKKLPPVIAAKWVKLFCMPKLFDYWTQPSCFRGSNILLRKFKVLQIIVLTNKRMLNKHAVLMILHGNKAILLNH